MTSYFEQIPGAIKYLAIIDREVSLKIQIIHLSLLLEFSYIFV